MANELRVFISSTFRDLQPEREHLMKKVFPEIRALCRERGVDFTEIDLRWGVTREEAEEFGVVRVCLEEIERCRPYFIGILGSRYGWVPDATIRDRSQKLFGEFPWLEAAFASGASITEIEIVHGALRQSGAAREGLVRFYFRDNSSEINVRDRADQSDQSDPSDQLRSLTRDEADHLQRLKRAIRESQCPVREGFRNAEVLGEQVREDLLAYIDAHHPAAESPTPLESERRRHAAFGRSRRGTYVADEALVAPLTDHVESDAPPLIVTADSGAGKSALLAYWAAEYRRGHDNAFVIEHYVGASAAEPFLIVRRIIEEIRARFGVNRDLPATPEATIREFSRWLAEVQREPLILIIDGVNQLRETGSPLAWLPSFIPSNVRMVISAAPGAALDELRRRGGPELHVTPLDAPKRATLIAAYLERSRKHLEPALHVRLAADPRCANPLFLCTILEELRLFGRHEEIGTWLEELLAVDGIDALFEKVLARLEADHGVEIVRLILSTLWASREGLFEDEVIGITARSRLAMSRLVLGLDSHLLRLDGRLAFFHDYLRQAVAKRYASTPEAINEVHRRIANYFAENGTPDRRAAELPWQLRELQDWEGLKESVSDISILQTFAKHNGHVELLGYWIAADGIDEMESRFGARLAAYRNANPNDAAYADALISLSVLLVRAGKFDASSRVAETGVAMLETVFGSEHLQVGAALVALGNAANSAGHYADAERHERRALKILEAQLGASHPDVAQSLNILANILANAGKFAEAEEHHRRALKIREGAFGPAHQDVAQSLQCIAIVCGMTGRYPEAEELSIRSLAIWEAALGSTHPDVALAMTTLSNIYKFMGRYSEMEPYNRRALAIFERGLGASHPSVGHALNNLAVTLACLGNLGDAEVYFRRSLAIKEHVLGPDHPYVASALNNLANTYKDLGRYAEAEEYYRRALTISENALGATHPDVAYSLSGLGQSLTELGRFDEAKEALMHALAIREELFGSDSSETAVTLQALGELMRAMRDPEGASAYFTKALIIFEATFGADHPYSELARESRNDLGAL